MIKLLKKYEIHTTPFEAIKNWAINNTHNDNLLLYETTGSDDGVPYALEFIDYGSGLRLPITSSACDIALEQQDADLATLELGVNVVGIFYPEIDPKNIDGTYMRSVYHQVRTMFYNQYFDPTKIWGSENIDFPLSRTERRLSDEIRLIDIPRIVFGDKIVPKSVLVTDNTTDNEYTITDDGYGNLRAGTNLFSHQQEIRHHSNDFEFGYTYFCDPYFDFTPPNPSIPITLVANQVSSLASVYLVWSYTAPALGFVIERSEDSGSTFTPLTSTGGTTYSTYDNTVLYGNTYWYRVYAFNSFGISPYSNVEEVPIVGIGIITQPQDISGDISSSVFFNVTASGVTPFYYQWQSGSTIYLSDDYYVTGSTTASIFINSLHLEDSGSYRVLINNAYDSITSSFAQLHVNLYPPVIDIQPIDQETVETLTASFTVSASQDNYRYTPISYQWFSGSTSLVDGVRITGSNSASVRINNLQASDTGSYRAYVYNRVGGLYSNYADLILLDNIIRISGSDSASVNTTFLFGSITNAPPFTEGTVPVVTTELLTGSVLTLVITMSTPPDTASVNAGFFGGSIFDTILTLYGGNETASVSSGFYNGTIFDVLVPIYGGNETASVSTGFSSGYTTLVVTESFGDDTFTDITTTLISGSVSGSSP